jgi:hypothetical protein
MLVFFCTHAMGGVWFEVLRREKGERQLGSFLDSWSISLDDLSRCYYLERHFSLYFAYGETVSVISPLDTSSLNHRSLYQPHAACD